MKKFLTDLKTKQDSLLGKGFSTYKFRDTVNLAIHRLAVLKKKSEARCSIARSDVAESLRIVSYDRALLKVEFVIKEQNMLDVYAMIEGYCNLLIERTNLLEREKVCPDELVEAVSSLIYAASRCGEFPELQELRKMFTARFGKEFVARAVDLRNNCGVNLKIIQKMSTETPSLEIKGKVIEEIALDNKIVLEIGNILPHTEEQDSRKKSKQFPRIENEDFEHSDKFVRQYRDVGHAAQIAFESAAYAATAARAAVELSRNESGRGSSNLCRRNTLSETNDNPKSPLHKMDSRTEEDQERKTEIVFGETMEGNGVNLHDDSSKFEHLDISRRPMSVRTKGRQGW